MINSFLYLIIFDRTLYRSSLSNIFFIFLVSIIFDIFTFRFIGSSFFPFAVLHFLTRNMSSSLRNMQYPFIVYYFSLFLIAAEMTSFIVSKIFGGTFSWAENFYIFSLSVIACAIFFSMKHISENLRN